MIATDAGSSRRASASRLVSTTAPSISRPGSVRSALFRYAQGRHDPIGPMGAKEYLVSMDRYCGFVYHVLIADMLNSPKLRRMLSN